MYSMHESQVQPTSLPGREHKMIVGPADGMLKCRGMCGGVAEFPAHTHASPHMHEASEEIIYVLQGSGEIFLNGQPEPLTPGRFVSIPPRVEHSIRNSGGEALKVLYVFSPPVVQGSYG